MGLGRCVFFGGRCNCHGHAESCDLKIQPYQCNCFESSHTEGNQVRLTCDHTIVTSNISIYCIYLMVCIYDTYLYI